ncbi:MAG: hypothetical protein EBZ69_10275, partial [Alphaproteobacteria bacterium]|nr:hypothetical protein [Alphaproteobacteria bacterium]
MWECIMTVKYLVKLAPNSGGKFEAWLAATEGRSAAGQALLAAAEEVGGVVEAHQKYRGRPRGGVARDAVVLEADRQLSLKTIQRLVRIKGITGIQQ